MKKKTVKMVSAVAALGILSGAYVGVNSYVKSQEAKENEVEDTSIEIINLESDEVTAVSFTADQGNIVFQKNEDVWEEKSDTDFPLDQDTVDSAVNNLISLSADQEITDVEDLSQYDLDEPQNTITVSTDDGETVLVIGMESSGNYYVKKDDDESAVYLITSSYIDSFMGSLYDFAQSGSFPSVTSATITDVNVEKEDGYGLSQDQENLFWNVSDGKNTEKADTTKAGNVTSAISSLSYDEFVDYNCTDDAEYGLDDPYAVITVKYTEEEIVEDTEEDADSEEEILTDEEADEETSESEETDTEEEEEPETITVDKELTIYVGDETGNSSRYVKVDDSSEVYTMTDESLSEILDTVMSDFYSLSVNYVALSDLDSLEISTEEESHKVTVTTETTIDEDDEDAEEVTTTVYKLDGEETDSSFTTFYNKLINITAQERMTEEYEPEEEPVYTFVFEDQSGESLIAEYYEYDTNFYAAVVEEKVYLVNKMNVRDLEEAYQNMITTEDEVSETEEE